MSGWKLRHEKVNESKVEERKDQNENVERLKELENENKKLRLKVWRLQYRSTIPVGLAMLAAGGISLLLAYAETSSILTFTGLGLILWGALVLFLTPARYVSDKTNFAISLSMIKTIDNIISSMNYKGRVVFFHPKDLRGITQGYIFVPYEESSSLELPSIVQLNEETVFCDDPKGISLVAPSQGLVDLFEKELNINFAMVDLGYVEENLPSILARSMKLADAVSIQESENGLIELTITGSSPASLCRSVTNGTKIGNHLGCPICSAFALIVSKVTDSPVIIESTIVDDIEDKIRTSYKKLDLNDN